MQKRASHSSLNYVSASLEIRVLLTSSGETSSVKHACWMFSGRRRIHLVVNQILASHGATLRDGCFHASMRKLLDHLSQVNSSNLDALVKLLSVARRSFLHERDKLSEQANLIPTSLSQADSCYTPVHHSQKNGFGQGMAARNFTLLHISSNTRMAWCDATSRLSALSFAGHRNQQL